MPLQIDEGEFEALRQRAAAADSAIPSQTLLNKLGAGKNRAALLRLIKEEYPNANIPEIDAAQPIVSEIGKVRQEMAELQKKLLAKDEQSLKDAAEKRANDMIKENRKKLREQGWMPDGIEKIEKLMDERGLTDYDAAAALVEKTEPKAESVLPNYDRGWNLTLPDRAEDSEDHKMLVSGVKGARQWQDKKIKQFFSDKASGRLVL